MRIGLSRKDLLAASFCFSPLILAQRDSVPSDFVVDANRPFVYLKFDHIGKGVRRSDDEPTERIWFRLVNNCKVGITVRTFGIPDGSLPDEISVMDEVVLDEPILTITPESGTDSSVNPVSRSNAGHEKLKKMPGGYSGEVSSQMIIQPGSNILFSLPINHLGEGWHVQIPFNFAVPKGHGLRLREVGGEPITYVYYTLYDLPNDIRSGITSGK